ncbi:MAG: ATP-binding protein [Gammaproteobacteria bacterium]
MSSSLRRTLLVTILTASAVVWGLVSISSYYASHREVNALFDDHLVKSSQVLLSLVSSEILEHYHGASPDTDVSLKDMDEIQEHLESHRHASPLAFQFQAGKQLSFHSARAPVQPLSNDVDGFSNTAVGSELWRVYTSHDSTGIITVRVAELLSGRDKLFHRLALLTLLPAGFGLLAMAFAGWQLVNLSLSPLTRLAADVRKRAPDNLAPLALSKLPREVTPVVTAMNELLGRLRIALDNESRFTSDAAHELRTPLAGLKTQVQLALRTGSDATRAHALKQCVAAIAQAEHLVEQLLTLARYDIALHQESQNVDLRRIVDEAIADINASNSSAQNVQVQSQKAVKLRGHALALKILARNLIDNAIRYGGNDQPIVVKLEHDNHSVVLTVVDTGPGIPADAKVQVLERFYRLADKRTSGVGLGLSIVQRIAEIHSATVELLDTVPHGLTVKVRFPADPSSNLARDSTESKGGGSPQQSPERL